MFAAHIDDNNIEQSVYEHCVGTAFYASEEGENIGLGNVMYLSGILHDIGKNTDEFNDYIHDIHDGKKIVRGKINHSSFGARYISESVVPKTKAEFLTKQMISYAIMSHHGLNDCLSYDGEDKYSARLDVADEKYCAVLSNSKEIFGRINVNEIFKKSSKEIEVICNKIDDIVKRMHTKKPVQERYFLYGCLSRLILSFLMDADRRDTAEFMSGKKHYRLNSNERQGYFNECKENLEKKLKEFSEKPDRNLIDELRGEMSEKCLEFAKNNGNGIYRLDIPTGGGKTFSAMRFALELAVKERKDRIIYTAPFLSILEQNADELKKVFQDSDNILEYHSNVLFKEDDEEILKRYELLSNEWSSPIIMTTLVRFLDVLFGGNTPDIRRLHQLKKSVVIIDEAQAIPVRYINMFNTMMNFLSGVCDTTIVLCTATQPIFERTERPLLYSENSNIIFDIKYNQGFKRTEIVNDYFKNILNTEELADIIFDNTDNNALIILNTKSAVEKLYDYIKNNCDEYQIIQLTTYMCAQHRLDIIEEMKRALQNNKKIICISTQLIEAGVDISFETVFRSLSGLDSIAQAAGRCNRNGKNSKNGKTYIIQYSEENVSSLEDIKKGQDAMKTRLDNYKGEDLLMPEEIEKYYRQYFFDRENDMDAPAQKYSSDFESHQSLYSFLSDNSVARKEYEKYNGRRYPYFLGQSFKTAASLFSPIERMNMVSLIVYYRDSKDIINRLYAENDLNEKKKLLKSLQRYTVNLMVSSKKYRELLQKSSFEKSLFDGALLILTEDSYSMETGVTLEWKLNIF